MRKCSKCLSPDNTKVSNASKAELGEDTVEDVTEKVHAETEHNSLSSTVASNWVSMAIVIFDFCAYKRSDTKLKVQETGIWIKRPTEAKALLVRPPKPKLLTMEGE